CLFHLLRPRVSPLFPYTTLFRSLTASSHFTGWPDHPILQTPFVIGSQMNLCICRPRRTLSPSAKIHSTSSLGSSRQFEASRSGPDRKSTRLNSSHVAISYAVFCL